MVGVLWFLWMFCSCIVVRQRNLSLLGEINPRYRSEIYWYEVVALIRRVALVALFQAASYRSWLMIVVCGTVFAIHEYREQTNNTKV